mgnify:CR=1 FL=1
MIAMMNTINDANFGGRKMVTCFTCHRGNNTPVNAPKLALQYGEPEDDPNVMNFRAETNITADQILDKYLQTLGGAAQLPAWHVSLCVQVWPSLQLVPVGFSGLEQMPVWVLHVPTVWH